MGHTMYVYGGGWDESDTKAGIEAKSIGESAAWKNFFDTQSSSYDYKNFLNCSSLGLDCTGYIGWTIYNLFNDKDGKQGYVFNSDVLGEKLKELGLGAVTCAENVTNYRAGDIFYSEKNKHAFICIGQCEDKSIVLAHSSPPGVMISGTVTPEGKNQSIAQNIANEFMCKCFPKWYAKFPVTDRGKDYLEGYNRFRFYKVIVSDPDEFSLMSPQRILKSLR